MNVDALMHIVHTERLDTPVLYGNGRHRPDTVVLERDGAAWTVYLTDERAQPFTSTISTFAGESEALEHVLLKLRQTEKLRRVLTKHPD